MFCPPPPPKHNGRPFPLKQNADFRRTYQHNAMFSFVTKTKQRSIEARISRASTAECKLLVVDTKIVTALCQKGAQIFPLSTEIGSKKFMMDGVIFKNLTKLIIKDIKFDDVPNKTILAAIELRKIFDDIKNRHLELWNNYFGFNPSTNIDLKCAIHVGDVIFGYWNSPSRVQITAMGKNVNFCSRLEGYANKNQIIISEEVNKLVIDKFDTNKLYIPKSERMKSFEHIDHVYEIIQPKF